MPYALSWGTDQGMCGQFNDSIIYGALEEVEKLKSEGAEYIPLERWGKR